MPTLSIKDRVTKIIVEQLQVDESEITPRSNFQEDLGADSLDQVELVMNFEDAFSIAIDDEEAEEADTVEKAIKLIESKLPAGATSGLAKAN